MAHKPLGFQKGDRVLVKASRNNAMNSHESYFAGEHGVILEVPEGSSVVQVRLDGYDGRQGNYHVVESVLPLMRRPVRQRFVDASVLHLEKMKQVMRGDNVVFVASSGKEIVGTVVQVDESKAEVLIQPLQIPLGEQYGPLERRPWGMMGPRITVPLGDAQCRVHLEEDNYLRDVSIEECRERGLLRDQDLRDEEPPLVALPAPAW
eukprot:TRINITY_DN102338_c0_g1_i1.p1 TRINITY_DN102338_c0_g1~~TRINITY_DN102338_c0_g1_i1.p1  ORF type:complete len:206 (-),score=40.93 TRINITY_DN102338_c0_g1_i1:146-763(-)